jgi:hypothetical protein
MARSRLTVVPGRTTPHITSLDISARSRHNRIKVYVPVAFALLLLAHAFDWVSFVVMTRLHGLAAEANPIVVLLAQEVGLPGLTVVKLAAVVFGGAVFVLLAPQRRRLAAALIIYGIAAGMVGGLSNVATIYAY